MRRVLPNGLLSFMPDSTAKLKKLLNVVEGLGSKKVDTTLTTTITTLAISGYGVSSSLI
jgi:hypothetical protein